MTATAVEKLTSFSGLYPAKVTLPMAAAVKILKGTLFSRDASGNAVPATDGDGFDVMGVADSTVDNTAGLAGAKNIEGTPGIHGPFKISGSAPLIGQLLFAVDNQTVSTSSDSDARGVAGVATKVESAGVHMMIGPGVSGLLAVVAAEVAAVNALQDDALTTQAVIPVPLGSFRIYSTGGALVPFNDGVADGIDPTAESIGFRFNVASTAAIAASVLMPNDLDAAEDVIVHVLGYRVGSADATAALTVGAFFRTAGAAFSADATAGGNTSAFDGATTVVTEETLTILAADVPASPSSLLLTLVPTAALDADDLVVLEVWLEYTRALLTA